MRRRYPVYVGIGSNLGDAEAHVHNAVRGLEALCDGDLICSPLYRSAPVGPQGQNAFINAVAGLHTPLGPFRLLAELLAIEQQHGRERVQHWGPRTLDLDLLLYHDLDIHSARLQVPHPEMIRRAFVLRPLLDVAPDLTLAGRCLSEWLNDCAGQSIAPL